MPAESQGTCPHNASGLPAAHEFLNFILRPDVIASISNEIYYGNDNRAADPLVNPAIRNDPAIYPTDAIRARLYPTTEMDIDTQRLRTRIWTRIKTGT